MRTFRDLKLKELFETPEIQEIARKHAPQLFKFPVKLFYKWDAGKVFDDVVKKKIVTLEVAQTIEKEINEFLATQG